MPVPSAPSNLPIYFFTVRRFLLCLAWLAASVEILLGGASLWLTEIGVASFGLFVLLTLPRLRWDSLAILGMLGVVALLPTMALVRATAATMPSVHSTQQKLAQLPAHSSASGLQIAGHIFGGIINIGVFAMRSAAVVCWRWSMRSFNRLVRPGHSYSPINTPDKYTR